MIHLTDSAAAELKRLAANDALAAPVVRVSVAEGGCSGMMYSMGVAAEPGEGHAVFAHDAELRVSCEPDALSYLDGLTIDFSKDLVGGGFKFRNPKASGSCGCGTSFRV